MPRIAYVNGRYVAHADAAVHIEDRGYQFADGVYEVCEVARGFIVDMPRHLGRLGRSLSELSIAWPVSRGVMPLLMREVVRRNHVTTGLVYLQVTRGVASRDFLFPPAGTPSSLVITARKADPAAQAKRAAAGIRIITVPENRWDRVDIKSVGLLPNVLAKQKGGPDKLVSKVHFMGNKDAGALIFASGAGIPKGGKQQAAAQQFIDWLADPKGGQAVLAQASPQYPLAPGVESSYGLKPLSELDPPVFDQGSLADTSKASDLIVEAGII